MDVKKKVGQSKVKRMNVRYHFVHGERKLFFFDNFI